MTYWPGDDSDDRINKQSDDRINKQDEREDRWFEYSESDGEIDQSDEDYLNNEP